MQTIDTNLLNLVAISRKANVSVGTSMVLNNRKSVQFTFKITIQVLAPHSESATVSYVQEKKTLCGTTQDVCNTYLLNK